MSRGVDVVLINPGSLKAVYQDLGRDLSAIEPPSLAGLFATYLRRKGVSVEIVDAPALNLDPAAAAKLVETAVVPGARERVSGDVVARLQGVLREAGPGGAEPREAADRVLGRVLVEELPGLGVLGQFRRRRLGHEILRSQDGVPPKVGFSL